MEAGGDNAVPAPGGVEDLVDTQFPREEAGDSERVHASTLDPGDGDPEDTGIASLNKALEANPQGLSLLAEREEISGRPVGSLWEPKKVA
jgi:hypothetical protein